MSDGRGRSAKEICMRQFTVSGVSGSARFIEIDRGVISSKLLVDSSLGLHFLPISHCNKSSLHISMTNLSLRTFNNDSTHRSPI